MPYVIVEPCIGSKDTSCIEVCPVDCIHPMPDEPDFDTVEHLYIDPDECIDCNACAQACPVDACLSDGDVPEQWRHYVGINAGYYTGQRAS
jgi:NAD-dependent dihydropyrimidine dehydrogenase PreA subunit